MGKQKDFRHVHHTSHKKKDKKIDKATKSSSRSSCQENYLKNVEVAVQVELDSIATAKKISRKVRKELDRYPLLAKAAFLGCERIVDSILEAGENVNVQAPDGSTPLMIAVENGYPNILQRLLKKGADPKLLRQDGRNALMIAVATGDNRAFTMIWNYWDKSNFWELNHTDSKGYTVLTIAVELGNTQFTNFLLSLTGIELDKQTAEGKTALMFAVLGGQVNVVQKLLHSGSDFVLEDKKGATAICLAISQNHREIKELFYECLDNKSRDIYVKKRIELLTRPRSEDNSVVTAFYKEILFRVILEIRRSFDYGVLLLEKHGVFSGLYKCLKTHQHDTELLRAGFHLTACLIYDKAEYSRYIAENLAEQYVSTKFAEFTLKIMQNYRLKSMTDLRGAAFLCIHAGTQCRSGKTWLKTNYFQLLPFVKEFKLILDTLTFWADGESTKAKIMFDRFVEIFDLIEKDLKISSCTSPKEKKSVAEPCSVLENMEKDNVVSTDEVNEILTATDSDWQLVSKSGSRNPPKASSNQAIATTSSRKSNKRRNRKLKLQTKLQNKINAKKTAQRPNLKFNAELAKFFPTLPMELQTPQTTCYADALKKNLKNEAIANSSQAVKKNFDSKIVDDHESDNESSLTGSTCSKFNHDLESKNLNESTLSAGDGENVDLKNNEQQSDGKFYDLWSSSFNSDYQPSLMSFITNLFELNAKKDEVSSNNAKKKSNDFTTAVPDASKNTHQGKQSKALRDILAALGLKTDPSDDDTDELRSTIKSKTEILKENALESSKNEERKNNAANAFKYSDCFKHKSGIESKIKKKSELKNAEAFEHVTQDVQKDTVKVKVSNDGCSVKNEQTLANECKKTIENDLKMKSMKTDESLTCCKMKTNEIDSSNKDPLRSELQSTNEILKKKDILVHFNSDSSDTSKDKNFVRPLKRKNPETYFRDLAFSFCKEEIKEIKEETSIQFSCCLEYFKNSERLLKAQNKIFAIPRMNMIKIESGFISDANLKGYFSSKDMYLRPSRSVSENVLNVVSSSSQDIPKKILGELSSERLKMPSKNLIYKTDEDKKLPDESKGIVCLKIEGNFSNFDGSIQKITQNQARLSMQIPLFSEKPPVLSEIILINLQRFIFTYKRFLLYQVMDQPHLSLLYMKTQSRLPKKTLVFSYGIDNVTEHEYLKRYDVLHQQTDAVITGKHSVAIREEYNMLVKFKSQISKITSMLLTCSSRKQQSRSIRKKGANSNVFNKARESTGKLGIPKERKNSDILFTYRNDTHGYKPKFINSEPTSRWFEKLHTIEECVPLTGFLLGFGEVKRNSSLHELISATGKIIFSSKNEHILKKGDFGTHIGIMENGNPVVVKMFENTGFESLELLFSKRRLCHKNVVQYYYLCSCENDRRLFTVTELCEYSLSEYIKTKMIHFDKKYLIQDLVDGIQYLHQKGIIHGFLKPSNIMVTIDDRLKVSDFYQLGVTPVVFGIVSKESKKIPAPIGSCSISDFCWRPYELVSATTEKDVRAVLTKASDIQMTGMLIYYILSGGKHPFGSSDLRCQENLQDGLSEFGPRPSDIESRDLVRDMIKRMPSQRLTIQEVARHPYLWNITHRFRFLVDVARKIDFFAGKPTKVAEALQDSCIEARDWTSYIHPQLLICISKWMNKSYANNYADLLHFILNVNDNFEILPQVIKVFIGHPSYFILKTFPTFFMSVYCVVRDNPFVQRQMALQAYFY